MRARHRAMMCAAHDPALCEIGLAQTPLIGGVD